MASFSGVVTRSDLEGGIWMLKADDGNSYQLRGGDAGLRKEGQRVTVQGSVDKGAMGIGMTGPYLDVSSWATS